MKIPDTPTWRGDLPFYAGVAILFMLILFADFRATHPHVWLIAESQPVRFTPDCWHLFDNGHHVKWAECMGVGYDE